ncbi:S1 RNA-binding domain-containing protein [Candidatus Peregrinibacteria bacterium]|nr:S1 RNA-binding domain-containing protein [Candidatus Peregrinibacteria bacterium]
MDDLLGASKELTKPELGSVITGTVVSVAKNKLVVDLNGVAVGIASGRETHDSSGTINDLKEGDEVKTVVIEEENDDGMVVLSLKKASQATTWDKFEKGYKEGTIIEITVSEANKGGLLIDIDGIKGFIPVSQLAPVHYPRVEDANAGQILTRLNKLIGIKMNVKIINLDRASGKMILSEKAAMETDAKKSLGELKVGSRVKGRVSGVVKFGIFVTFDGLEGLVHISEIAWGHVSNPHQYAKTGDTVEVEIIGIEGEKLSLSMKRLIPDPWSEIEAKYPIGTKVKGVINRFSPFGAFVQLEDDINGLIHLSEISNQKVDDPADFLKTGEEVEAQVINIDRDEHRIGLSLKALSPNKKATAKAKDVDAEEKPKKKESKKEEKEEVAEEVVEDKAEKEEKEEKPKKKAAAKKTAKKK